MKRQLTLIPLIILLALALSACGVSAERTLDKGNQSFEEEAYQDAMISYSQVIEKEPTLAEPFYNLANALYRLGAFEEAGQFLSQSVQTASRELAEHSFYNLGNNFFQQEQLDGAVEAYKEALRIDSNDVDAKYNLELAMQEQEQQEQEQQEQEQEQQQDQQEQGQDQSEEQQNQDQDGQGQDEGEQSEQEQEGEGQPDEHEEGQDEQNQDQQGQNGDPQQEQGQDAQGQPQPAEGLTEEQAKQLLAAIGEATDTLQEKLQEVFVYPAPPPAKDW